MLFLTRTCFFRLTRRYFVAIRGTAFLSLTRGHLSRSRLGTLWRGHLSRSRFWSLWRGHVSRSRFSSLTRDDLSGSRFWSQRRGDASRNWLGSLTRGHLSRSRSGSLMRGYLGGTLSPFARLGLFFRGDAMVSLLPPSSLAAMVRFIETLVILLTFPVCAPVGILPLESLPVTGVPLIPRLPLRLIPVRGSFNIAGRIRVIRGPAVLGPEKIIQQSLYKPVTVVIDPRRIRPDPRLRVTIRTRGG